MASHPYIPRSQPVVQRPLYPIVEFARIINKNTSEFTAKDTRRFIRWLWDTRPYGSKRYTCKRKWRK